MLTQNSRVLLRMRSTAVSFLRGLRAYGINRSMGHVSMFIDTVGILIVLAPYFKCGLDVLTYAQRPGLHQPAQTTRDLGAAPAAHRTFHVISAGPSLGHRTQTRVLRAPGYASVCRIDVVL